MEKPQQTHHHSTSSRLGAMAWTLGAIQFFTCLLVARLAWKTPYDWTINTVSDLGNVYCQNWGDYQTYVCSPLHQVADASLVVLGILIAAGILLLGSLWKRTFGSRVARGFMIIAAAAFILIGFVPADVDENLHVLGGFLLTFFGNTGLLLASPNLRAERLKGMRFLAPAIGCIGLLATVLFFSHHYLGIGKVMERFWGYNVPVWTLITGGTLLMRPGEIDR